MYTTICDRTTMMYSHVNYYHLSTIILPSYLPYRQKILHQGLGLINRPSLRALKYILSPCFGTSLNDVNDHAYKLYYGNILGF